MKRTIVACIVAAAAAQVTAQPTAQVVLTQPQIAAFGDPIVDGDAGNLAADRSVTPARIVFWNGGDTDDSDGDSIIRITPGVSGFASRGTGNDAEAAIAAVGGTAVNQVLRGMAVSPTNGNAFIAIDPSGPSQAYLIRFDMNTTNVEVIAGGTSAGNVMDGTVDIECIGTTVYVLQRQAFGAPADRIVAFNGTAPQGITQLPSATYSLSGVFGGTQALSGLAADKDGHLLVVDSGAAGVSDSIGRLTLPAGTFSVIKTGASIAADLVASGITDFGYGTGNIEVDHRNNDVYLLADKDFCTPIAAGDFIVRIPGGTGTAQIYITEAQTATQVGGLGGTGLLYNNNFSLAFLVGTGTTDHYLYVSNDNNGGDGIFRIQAPATPMAGVTDWTLFE
ncbi:MAG: hypothetical protein N2111_08415 [Candidatus Sumerlaeaceae bacterium]|nr:hypothetical protein [Candidatus Sumerlaeaceae bacterium]